MKFKIFQASIIKIGVTLIAILLFITGCLNNKAIRVIKNNENVELPKLQLMSVLGEYQADNLLAVYTAEGDVQHKTVEEVRKAGAVEGHFGIVMNPPKKQITDIKEIVQAYISNGQKVLLIYIDGLGYNQYISYMEKGCIPAIAALGTAEKALTVYPPITDVAYTSMVTGKTPKYTGIHNRTDSDLKAETIFEELEKQGHTYTLIEGSSNIVNADLEVRLNIDENKDGNIDDDIMNCVMDNISNKADLMFVHFHSYDDMGHSYGPLSEEAQQQIELLDEYVKALTENWKSTIILTSDHGMHTTEDGGNHGSFCAEDIYIPLEIYER